MCSIQETFFLGLKNIIHPWNLIKSLHILFFLIYMYMYWSGESEKKFDLWCQRCVLSKFPSWYRCSQNPDRYSFWNQLSDLFLPYMKLMSSWLIWLFMTFPILFFYYVGCVCDVKETTDGYHWEADQSLWGFEGVSALGVNYRWCFKVIFVNIYL